MNRFITKESLIVLLCSLIVCCVFSVFLPKNNTAPTINITTTPTNTHIPIRTPLPTATIDQVAVYKLKIVSWSADIKYVTDVLTKILNGEKISSLTASQAGNTLRRVRRELHSYSPPAVYVTFHTHYTNGVDDLENAIVALSNGKLNEGLQLLDHGIEEMKKAELAVPK